MKRGQSAAYLLALRKKYGLGEFKKGKRVSKGRTIKKNARKVPKRSKSKPRQSTKTAKSFKMDFGW